MFLLAAGPIGPAMTHAILEHVNITVGSAERTAAMLEALFGWTVRWRGPSAMGGRTIHVGSGAHYIAVYTPDGGDGTALAHDKSRPLNHVGVEVDDLDATEARALASGLTPFNHDDYAPGRRFYIFDGDGIEWEIVNYADHEKAAGRVVTA